MQATIRIPGYDSLEQIAVGGMAVVFRARKLSLKKTVAIKVLLPDLAADARFVSRFQQEAEAAARVQHENIVNVLDYGHEGGSYYIVMEFYDGRTVEELLRDQARLPVDIALGIALHVAAGLDAAHAENLVHRDIKPANIILTRQGAIKIADFGLAKDVEKATLMTHAGKVVGTPAYMSPEQTRGEPVERCSDIFSLGVVLYEMLAGKRPFEGSSFSEVIDRIQSFEPPSPGSLNPQVDAAIEAIVTRMMAKSQAQRFRLMSEVVAALEAVVAAHEFRVDRRVLKEYFDDPAAYTASARSEASAAGVRGLFGRFAERLGKGPVAAIEADAGKRREQAEVLDPDLDYRVTLLAIDRKMETPDSFALKLAMRLKAPVPRMRSLASRTPCILVERLPYKKARWLVSVVKELGGEARMDAIRERGRLVDPIPEPPPAEPAASARVASHKPARSRRLPGGAVVCPSCGWEADADARFCSMCHHNFNKTDKIDVRSLRHAGFEDPFENPLLYESEGNRPGGRLRGLLAAIPAKVIVGAGAALLLLPIVVLLMMSR
ncbi:MAG TPA: protein kinase [Candidatus Krumholzibacteria bacterium]|nr:protein kinase [Candidatus Krumholzibacteria bacterium]